MDSDDVSGSQISKSEAFVTMVTLEPVHLVILLVNHELVCSLKTPSAVLQPAEVGMSQVHLLMNPDGPVMDCLESAQFAKKLVIIIAMLFVSRIGGGLEVLAALVTSDNFMDFVMTIEDFLVIICEIAAVTP